MKATAVTALVASVVVPLAGATPHKPYVQAILDVSHVGEPVELAGCNYGDPQIVYGTVTDPARNYTLNFSSEVGPAGCFSAQNFNFPAGSYTVAIFLERQDGGPRKHAVAENSFVVLP